VGVRYGQDGMESVEGDVIPNLGGARRLDGPRMHTRTRENRDNPNPNRNRKGQSPVGTQTKNRRCDGKGRETYGSLVQTLVGTQVEKTRSQTLACWACLGHGLSCRARSCLQYPAQYACVCGGGGGVHVCVRMRVCVCVCGCG
jgi:hypothetical protein